MEIYIVKQGDTLENIASLYNVSVNDIIKANNLKMPFNLEVGTALNIALGITNIFDYYTILKGDTLYSVAKSTISDKNFLSFSVFPPFQPKIVAASLGRSAIEYLYVGMYFETNSTNFPLPTVPTPFKIKTFFIYLPLFNITY